LNLKWSYDLFTPIFIKWGHALRAWWWTGQEDDSAARQHLNVPVASGL
jgi:hypothetical protein